MYLKEFRMTKDRKLFLTLWKPIWDNTKCIKCGVCYIFCPEGCIIEKEGGLFEADLDYCKGCGICAHECWPGAITMVEEE